LPSKKLALSILKIGRLSISKNTGILNYISIGRKYKSEFPECIKTIVKKETTYNFDRILFATFEQDKSQRIRSYVSS